jgi:hypothetical protein
MNPMPTTRRALGRFVILFPGRAGGTFLAVTLDRSPGLTVKPEPLGLLARRGPRHQARWIRNYYRGPLLGRARAVGLSTKVADVLDPDDFRELLRSYEARVVLLDRRNDVKHAVSIVRAQALKERTGRWNRREAGDELGRIRIEPEDFARRLERSRARKVATREYAASLDLPMLAIDYEELAADPAATIARVCAHLGVEPVAPDPSVRKVTSDRLADSVENLDELRAPYVGTDLEAMFDETPSG